MVHPFSCFFLEMMIPQANGLRNRRGTIYPEGFEKYHFKAAIPARNRYLVDNSAYAICYVTHDWGGAAKTYQRAVKKGLTIIKLGERKDGRDNL